MKYEKSEKRNKCLNVGPSPLVSMQGLSNSNEEISKFRLHDWDGCNVSAITELYYIERIRKYIGEILEHITSYYLHMQCCKHVMKKEK